MLVVIAPESLGAQLGCERLCPALKMRIFVVGYLLDGGSEILLLFFILIDFGKVRVPAERRNIAGVVWYGDLELQCQLVRSISIVPHHHLHCTVPVKINTSGVPLDQRLSQNGIVIAHVFSQDEEMVIEVVLSDLHRYVHTTPF